MKRPVILGLGNILLQDEGVGVHLVQQLMQEDIAQYTELIDGGTDALSLLGIVEDTDQILVVDAIWGGNPPGTIKALAGEDIPLLLGSSTSVHQIGFQEVLALARWRGRLPGQMTLIGVEPYSTDWGLELSPIVAEQLPQIRGLVYKQISQWLDH